MIGAAPILVAAVLAADAGSADAGLALRVVTWNIDLGGMLDRSADGGVADAPKTGALVAAIAADGRLRGPDLLGVQELCAHQDGWQLRALDRVVARADAPAVHAFAIADDQGPGYGHCQRGEALISRFPIVASGRLALPTVNEVRSALWADVDVGGAIVRVYVAHLEARPKRSAEEGRRRQAQVVLDHLLEWRRAHPGGPLLLMGDLNTVGNPLDSCSREATVTLLAAHLEPSVKACARTHRVLASQLDWIFSCGLKLERSGVVHLDGSDHYPVVADYSLIF